MSASHHPTDIHLRQHRAEKAEQAARADCGRTGGRTGRARSQGAANVFTIPPDEERVTASIGRLGARRRLRGRLLSWRVVTTM